MTSRILYVTHRVPWPPDRGDRIRTWNILRFLASRSTVDVACLADEPVDASTLEPLRSLTRRLAVVPHRGRSRFARGLLSLVCGGTVTEGLFDSPLLAQVVRNWAAAEPYDAVLASSSGVARYILPPIVDQAAQRWVDLIDVDSQKWLDYAAASRWPRSWIYGLEGRRLRKRECRLAADCDCLVVVSEAERELFRSFCAESGIQAVGNGVDADYFAHETGHAVQRHTCVFVGVMNYKPNADAVIWFADNVWPAVKARYPDAMFRIVGKSPNTDVLQLADRDGIEVTGGVPDVRPFLNSAACVVVPLQIARGVQNKVLEAMSCGRPVVCAPAPLKGLAVRAGVHVLQADSAAGWTEAVSRIFDDAGLGSDLGLAAATYVRQHHVWDRCLESFNDLTCVSERCAGTGAEVPG